MAYVQCLYSKAVLSSSKLLEKSSNYDLLHPWLGRGLLTNTGDGWRQKRKLLTPAFHFRILNDFIPIIDDNSRVLVDILRPIEGQVVDIRPMITACTLDIICETAMGVTVDAQNNCESDYVKSIHVLGESFMKRTVDPIAWIDWIYFRTKSGKDYLKSLNTVHGFTRNVIRQRKEELLSRGRKAIEESETRDVSIKRRVAFLDLLLEQHMATDGRLSEEDIREEVDTFMFEGHDTTAVSLCWTLFLIGSDPEVQRKLDEEIEDVFLSDKTRAITTDDLSRLKYLECCIKESLRLYPSVPAIAREATQDFKLKSYTIPKGATLHLFLYALHRNEEQFPQPEVFRPERFLSNRRFSPYAYVPFSAGPRNCIGQRFAMTEQKIVIANLLRNYRVRSVDKRDCVRPAMELVTRAKDPIRLVLAAK